MTAATFEDYHEFARAITDMYVRDAPMAGATRQWPARRAAFGMALAADRQLMICRHHGFRQPVNTRTYAVAGG